MTDSELLNEFDFSKVKMIVSTIPDLDTNLLLINKVKETGNKVIITVVSHQIDEAIKLYEEGATYVVMPHFLGGHHVATMIKEHKLNFGEFLKERLTHIEHLKLRKDAEHEHPIPEKHK